MPKQIETKKRRSRKKVKHVEKVYQTKEKQ
jgi:hypothetical protein